ncbi:MAG: antitoxin VapB family protein [candidate division NC10 bacterium]
MHMTKTISLSEEAYRRLKRHKRGKESFSDTVKRLASSRSSLLDLLDLHPELVGDPEYPEHVLSVRREIEARLG